MNSIKSSCIAIGNFDGLHIGHDILIKRMLELSNENNLDSIILTFKYVRNDMKKTNSNLKYIYNNKNKMNILSSYNPTYLEEIELDEVVSKYSPLQFIEEILVNKYHAKYIVVGYNFTFGHRASGDVNTLKSFEDRFNYLVEEIYPIKFNGIAISSTLIRNLLQEGKISEANHLLSQNYTIYKDEINFDYNKNIGFVDNNLGIIIPCDGKYIISMGCENYSLSIINKDNGSVISFDKKIEYLSDIIFINKEN